MTETGKRASRKSCELSGGRLRLNRDAPMVDPRTGVVRLPFATSGLGGDRLRRPSAGALSARLGSSGRLGESGENGMSVTACDDERHASRIESSGDSGEGDIR